MDDHVIAGAKLAVTREHVVERVPVERADDGIGIGGAGGANRVQPLRRRRIVRRLSGGLFTKLKSRRKNGKQRNRRGHRRKF